VSLQFPAKPSGTLNCRIELEVIHTHPSVPIPALWECEMKVLSNQRWEKSLAVVFLIADSQIKWVHF